MGKHFDTLVELLKEEIHEDNSPSVLPNVHDYLTALVRRAALFEFPLHAQNIRPTIGKDQEEYRRYLNDYITMSQEYGKLLVTPFDLTAIEDPDSVVFFDNQNGSRYLVTVCTNSDPGQSPQLDRIVNVFIGDITITPPLVELGLKMNVIPIYFASWFNGARIPDEGVDLDTKINCCTQDLSSATMAYVEETTYIMDPSNFIVYKENNQSIKERKKQSQNPNRLRKPQKTILRPHYICLSEQDTISFLKGESKEPRPIHPVRGHWKTLISPRYKNAHGKRIQIAQYYRGKGSIEGKNGWHYQVFVKENPVTLTPIRD